MVWNFIPWILNLLGGSAGAGATTAGAGATGAAGTSGGLLQSLGGLAKGVAGEALSPVTEALAPIKEGWGGIKGLLKPETSLGKVYTAEDLAAGGGTSSLTGMLKGVGKQLLERQTGLEGTPQTSEDWINLIDRMGQMQRRETEKPVPRRQSPNLMQRTPQRGMTSLLDDYWSYY